MNSNSLPGFALIFVILLAPFSESAAQRFANYDGEFPDTEKMIYH